MDFNKWGPVGGLTVNKPHHLTGYIVHDVSTVAETDYEAPPKGGPLKVHDVSEVSVPPLDLEHLKKTINSIRLQPEFYGRWEHTKISKPRHYGKSQAANQFKALYDKYFYSEEETTMSNQINETDAKAVRYLNEKQLQLYKLGVIDYEGDLTDAGTALLWTILIEANHDALVEAVGKVKTVGEDK